ncbi:MAG TPA: quinoprotein relay system zinc metallohydrolase 2 [Steroidobacteraceae bacterium]|nr:quinoprotein relay system zinc metallohydrolase 2 [Steroidobacteraceae bacterium]
MSSPLESPRARPGARFSRREVLLGGGCLCCFAGLAVRAAAPLALREVAPGIHIRAGVDEEATAQNAGAIANVGCIVGSDSVAVVDPGGSLVDGEQLRTAIRQVTKLPIRHVILSHVHPDHIFGAGAFLADQPKFVGHARLPYALGQRGEYYRARLEKVLGKEAAGSVVMPTMLVGEYAQIDLGNRALTLTAHATAHSDCDLSVFDRQTRTLLPADLLFVRRVPSLDGSILGWQKALATLKALNAERAVPGHGPASVAWPSGAADLERYLDVLLRETRAAIAKGMDIGAATQSVAQSERGRWTLFEEYHGHNVTKAFKELEWE